MSHLLWSATVYITAHSDVMYNQANHCSHIEAPRFEGNCTILANYYPTLSQARFLEGALTSQGQP